MTRLIGATVFVVLFLSFSFCPIVPVSRGMEADTLRLKLDRLIGMKGEKSWHDTMEVPVKEIIWLEKAKERHYGAAINREKLLFWSLALNMLLGLLCAIAGERLRRLSEKKGSSARSKTLSGGPDYCI